MNRKGHVRIVGGIIVVAAGILAGAAISTAGQKDPWGCPLEQVALEVVTTTESGGYVSRIAAVDAWLPSLAEQGVAPRSRLEEAIENQQGETRFDSESKTLVIDGSIVASFSIKPLDDGSLAVGTLLYCTPPPKGEAASPGATPVTDIGGEEGP